MQHIAYEWATGYIVGIGETAEAAKEDAETRGELGPGDWLVNTCPAVDLLVAAVRRYRAGELPEHPDWKRNRKGEAIFVSG